MLITNNTNFDDKTKIDPLSRLAPNFCVCSCEPVPRHKVVKREEFYHRMSDDKYGIYRLQYFLASLNIKINNIRLWCEICELVPMVFGTTLFTTPCISLITTKNELIITNKYLCNKLYRITIHKKGGCSNVSLKIQRNGTFSVCFEFSKGNMFPCQAPTEILINKANYLSLIKNIDTNFLRLLGLDTDCLCCKSAVYNDWSSLTNLVSILIEIDINYEYIMMYIYFLHLKVILRKYLHDDLDEMIFKHMYPM